MNPIHLTADNGTVKIGARLRASRLAQGLTLERLATATGLSKGFLSRIERDDTMPSVTTLVQLCQALSLPIGSLFEDPEIQVVHRDAAPRINMGGVGADEWLVSPRSEEQVQVIRSSLEPGANGGDALYTVNCNLEVLHVFSGKLTVKLADREVKLEAGDTLTLPGRTPHNWHTDSSRAEVMWVLIPAAWSGSA